jgi:hypothetical protein
MDQPTPDLSNNQAAPVPSSNKKLLIYVGIVVALVLLIGAGIWWVQARGKDKSPAVVAQDDSQQTVSDEVASYPQPLFYIETEKPEYFLHDISGLNFTIKPFDKKMNIAKPIKTHVTMEKPDGKKATVEVTLEVSAAYNGCYEKDTSKCTVEQLYFRQEPFTFYGYNNNFFSADQVGTYKLTSSNGVIKPLNFEVKTSIITSLFIEQGIGNYKFIESNDMGSRGNHQFYSGDYTSNGSFLNVFVAVKNSNSDFKVEYDHPAFVGNISLESAPVITFNGNKIKLNDCGECDLDKGSSGINFSLGWPTKDGFVNMYSGVGDKYGDAEKEVVKQYLVKYPSILK